MTRYGLLCLLLGALAWGQAQTPSTPAAPPANATQKQLPPPGGTPPGPEAANVPPDAPVITITGLCGKTDAGTASASDCKTVITREQFEKMVDAVQPGMPARMRRQFASRYANALVMSEKGEQLGLDKGPDYEEHMKLARMQVLSQELNKALQEKAGEITDKDIEDYYKANVSKFEQADVERIYIPKTKQTPEADSDKKLSEAEEQKQTEESEAAMKKEADKAHSEAVAGTDFAKLQQEAFEFAGIKSGSPNVNMGKMRRTMLPPSQVSVMEQKPGEVSAVIADQNGFFIYKLKSKDTIPLDQAKDEIRGTLRSQRFQESMKAVQEAATPTLDEKYFGAAAPPRPGLPPPMPAGSKPPATKPDPD